MRLAKAAGMHERTPRAIRLRPHTPTSLDRYVPVAVVVLAIVVLVIRFM